MPRVTLALVLGTGLLVTTWVSAPAAPTPAPVYVSPEELTRIEALAPLADEVEQEAAQLQARLRASVEPPQPRRDPFHFGARRDTVPAPRVDTSVPERVETAAPAPAVLWPVLAGIVEESAAEPRHTAVLGWGDALEFLTVGGTFKDFVVTAVSAGSIELRHQPTGLVKTLTLR